MGKLPRLLPASLALLLAVTASADPLREGFAHPPDSAKPQTWWHWMNGNVTRTGITADLEAMKDIGLGGATIVNVDCGIPHGNAGFMTPRWRDDFKFAVSEANRLGLHLCVENCAGWSSSGGPWNKPENAMQRLTSAEVRIDGPAAFDAVLPQPTVNLKTYHEIAVLAFKVPPIPTAANSAVATEPKFEITKAVYEAASGGGSADVKAKLLALIQRGQKSVIASNDELGGDPASGQKKRLRVDFTLGGKPDTISVDENDTLIFPTNAERLKVAKSAAKTSVDQTFVHPPALDASTAGTNIPLDDIIDVSSKMSADGRLKWDVPAGSWIILRTGFTPIGVNNHPSPPEGLGLECDKMSKSALDAHWDGFMQQVLNDVGPLAGKSLDASLIDSYEVGLQDWTPAFRDEFQTRRGYDPVRYLPAFTRRVVGDPKITGRFLWDVRRTVADLYAENYYGHFTDLCHQHGISSAIEPYDGPYESLQCGSTADLVMGEFWTGSSGHPSVKMCASVAHIYGKTVVGAESFTAGSNEGRWSNDPYQLKTLGDLMYCQGLNRYVFHRYAMQPWTDRFPGMTMGEFGLQFERTQTWWGPGKAWIDYITHCQYLLQQGRAVADVAYYSGQNAPSEMHIGNPEMPKGYDYDAINSDVLMHGATVVDGRIKLTSGQSYAVLVLPPDDLNMTPAMLECVRNLVRAGATVAGHRPENSPSLQGYPFCDDQVKQLAGEMWGPCDGKAVTENTDGKGRIVWGRPLADIFAAQKLLPDFEFKAAAAASHLEYVHRVTPEDDIYFVSNQNRVFDSAECTFRVSGKVPELWHPDTGVIEPAPVWGERNGRTTVHLNFDPAGSVFVIFRPSTGFADHVVSAAGTMTGSQSAGPRLEIRHAVYTSVDSDNARDVTAKLAGLVQDGRLEVAVTNDALGPDPATMHKKELRVEYTLDGRPGKVTVAEDQTLSLPSGPSIGLAPQWEASVDETGSPVVKLWANGRVELGTEFGKKVYAVAVDLPSPVEVTGGWKLSFPPKWGAPPSVELDHLMSWTGHPDAGVKYFSGTATYEKDVEMTADQLKTGREVWLDLGTVKNLAEVWLNGHDLPVLWKAPFRANLTSAAQPGVNKLVIKVTNLWPNRLIGDEQLPADCEWNGAQLKAWPQWLLDGKPSPTGRFTFATWHFYNKDSPLLESGLIGPVVLRTAEVVRSR
jgi:hypothetical protein